MFSHLGTTVGGIGISDIRERFSDFRDDRRPADGKIPIILGRKLQGFNLNGTDPDLMSVIKETGIFNKLTALDLDFQRSSSLGLLGQDDIGESNLTESEDKVCCRFKIFKV
jgi:hypothetical protein